MNNAGNFKKKLISQIVAAGLVSGLGTAAFATEFYLDDNEITWSNGSSSGSAVIAATGLAGTIELARPSSGSALPNVSFTLKNNADNPAGTYKVRVFMEVKNDVNEVEMRLGTVQITVDANGDVTNAAMVATNDPDYTRVRVYARRNAIDLATNFTAIPQILSFSDGVITMQVDEVVERLTGSDDLFDDILDRFTQNGDFDYRIGVSNLGASTARIGTIDGTTWTVSPATATINLAEGALNEFNTNTTFIGGVFNIVDPSTGGGDTGGGGGTPGGGTGDDDDDDPVLPDEPDPVVNDDDVAAVEDELNNLDDDVDNLLQDETSEAPPNLVTSVTNVANTATNQTTQLIEQSTQTGGVVNTNNALNVLSTATRATTTSTTVAGRTTDTQARETLVSNANTVLTNTSTILTNLASNTSRTDLGTTQQTQVQNIASNVVSSVDRLVDQATNTDQLRSLAENASAVLQAQAELGVPATTEQVETVINTSVKIATSLLREAINAGGGEAPTDDEIRDILTGNPALLEAVVANTLPVPPTVTIPISQRQQNVSSAAQQRGVNLPEQANRRAAQATTKFVNPENVQIGGVNVLSLLNTFLSGGSTQLVTLLDENGRVANVMAVTDNEASISVDSTTGAVVVRLPGETYSGMIVAVRAVPTAVPNGVTIRRDGRAVIVTNGTAVELAPNSADLISMIATLEGAGFEFNQRENASFTLNLGGGQQFAGAFAYDNLAGQAVEQCGAVEFTGPMGSQLDGNYVFTMNCANGIDQRIAPFPFAQRFFDSLQQGNLTARIDRSSGVINVEGVGNFRPSFFVDALTDADRAYRTANADSFGIAYQPLDINGDGITDYKVISANGVQVLFGLP